LQLEALMQQCELDIQAHARHSEAAQRLGAVNGIGPISASAIVATVGNAADFRNGRQMAAWSGLVPKQSSSGGKERLGKITKRGDTYLRGLLTQGARSTLNAALARPLEPSPSLTSTSGSAGRSWRAESVTTRTPHCATCAQRPESASRC